MQKIISFSIILLSFLNASAQTSELQALINKTPDGGTLTIAPGKYVSDQSLDLIGRSGITIKGNGAVKIYCSDVWKEVVHLENSQSIRITGIYFSHEKPLKEYQCNGGVIDLTSCQKILIEDCELEGSGTVGVYARSTSDLTVDHCYIHDNTFNAFYLQDCKDVLFTSNVVQNNANFIQLYDTDGFEMSDNVISGNGGYWRDKDPKPGLRTGGKGK